MKEPDLKRVLTKYWSSPFLPFPWQIGIIFSLPILPFIYIAHTQKSINFEKQSLNQVVYNLNI